MAMSEKAKALLDGKALGMLGLVSEDGSIQVTPVWITRDGESPVFNTVESRPKARAMRRDPRVTLTIVDPENGYSYVELRGRVEFEEGLVMPRAMRLVAIRHLERAVEGVRMRPRQDR